MVKFVLADLCCSGPEKFPGDLVGDFVDSPKVWQIPGSDEEIVRAVSSLASKSEGEAEFEQVDSFCSVAIELYGATQSQSHSIKSTAEEGKTRKTTEDSQATLAVKAEESYPQLQSPLRWSSKTECDSPSRATSGGDLKVADGAFRYTPRKSANADREMCPEMQPRFTGGKIFEALSIYTHSRTTRSEHDKSMELHATTTSSQENSNARGTSSAGNQMSLSPSSVREGSSIRGSLKDRLSQLAMGYVDTEITDTLELGNVRNFLCFSDSSYLRGMNLALLLRGRGDILRDNGGIEKVFSYSKEVSHIDTFISHNWSVGRLLKFAALAVHFNMWIAAAAVLIFIVILCALCTLPLPGPTFLNENLDPWPRSVIAQILMVPIFLVTLFIGRDVIGYCGWRGPVVFLDKTCINQSSPELQRRGIDKLGAFLSKSSRMVVVYTDVYLQKLWTVYEMAAFLVMRPLNCMDVASVAVTTKFIGFLLWIYLATLILLAIEVTNTNPTSKYFAIIPTGYGFIIALRNHERQQQKISSHVADFDVDKATCFSESDRPILHSNIATLMREVSVVSDDAPEAVALEAFNRLVHENLSDVLGASLGRFGFSYRYVLALSSSIVLPRWVDAMTGALHHSIFQKDDAAVPLMSISSWFLFALTNMLGVLPLVFALCSRLSRLCLHLPSDSFKEFLVVTAVIVSGGGAGKLSFFLEQKLFYDLVSSATSYLPWYLAYCLGTSLAACFVFLPHGSNNFDTLVVEKQKSSSSSAAAEI